MGIQQVRSEYPSQFGQPSQPRLTLSSGETCTIDSNSSAQIRNSDPNHIPDIEIDQEENKEEVRLKDNKQKQYQIME
ncbi:hypothetical protein FGO68_gene2281 [Halteria grandinella]|uniref:Uncharacterized protein n=1 Tax=Halteria grandinella TaxID=5974 RepID=A0A8J8T1H8_HALGN|nr:hypothetical protein FGO68_gene2281 [Halteria grandinella]